jgi:hypothetical protein
MAALSRRAALAVPLGLAAVGAASAAPVPAANPDAALIALCGRHLSWTRRWDRLNDACCAAEDEGQAARADRIGATLRSAVDYGHSLLGQVMETPARTRAGLVAKARVAMTRVTLDMKDNPAWEDTPLWSLCRDLLGGDPGVGA